MKSDKLLILKVRWTNHKMSGTVSYYTQVTLFLDGRGRVSIPGTDEFHGFRWSWDPKRQRLTTVPKNLDIYCNNILQLLEEAYRKAILTLLEDEETLEVSVDDRVDC